MTASYSMMLIFDIFFLISRENQEKITAFILSMSIYKSPTFKPHFFQNIYHTLLSRHVAHSLQSLQGLREKILFNICLWASIFGGMAYFPSVYAAYLQQDIDVIFVNTFIYGCLLVLLVTRLGYKLKALTYVVLTNLLALYLLWKFGAVSTGFLWLGLGPVLAILLLGWREALSLWLMYIPVFFLLTMYRSAYREPVELGSEIFWVMMSGNFLLITALMVIPIHTLISGLISALKKEERHVDELSKTQSAMIGAISSLAEFRDMETGNHIKRTQNYVKALAQELAKSPKYADKLNELTINTMFECAPLHDIGKIGVPDRILLKPDALTKDELKEMRKHADYGYETFVEAIKMLGHQSFPQMAAEIAYSHHEKWDGSGYPLQLKGDEIPLSGRIMAVADVYDALISKRCYKRAFSHTEAINMIVEQSGQHFDPDIIDCLKKLESRFYEIKTQFADQ